MLAARCPWGHILLFLRGMALPEARGGRADVQAPGDFPGGGVHGVEAGMPLPSTSIASPLVLSTEIWQFCESYGWLFKFGKLAKCLLKCHNVFGLKHSLSMTTPPVLTTLSVLRRVMDRGGALTHQLPPDANYQQPQPRPHACFFHQCGPDIFLSLDPPRGRGGGWGSGPVGPPPEAGFPPFSARSAEKIFGPQN